MSADNDSTSASGGISFESQNFAFGQRIGVTTESTDTEVLKDALDALTTIPGGLTDVLDHLFGADAPSDPKVGYDASAKWLAGADLSGIGVLSLLVLLIDNSFYGLKISIEKKKDGGENGGEGGGEGGDGEGGGGEESSDPLGGLELEVVYRKINNHLGEFSGDLTLPEEFRVIKLGEGPEAATVTLPSVGIAIFTNGDFKVSIGWPLGERSFNITFPPDPIPWAGGGGLYFAKLRSEDLPSVPPGFDPIIEFGIGLRIGVATEGTYAIVKYSASLYLFGTFQGFLAWGKGKHVNGGIDYYWFCATVGITGHLEGSIDFKIISVSIALDVTLSLTLALELGHRGYAVAQFDAKVTAKLTFLFITIHFSFHLHLQIDASFGNKTLPPAKTSGPSFPDGTAELEAATRALEEPARARVLAFSPAPAAAGAGPTPLALGLLLQPTVRNTNVTLQDWKSQSAAVASLVIQRTPPASGVSPAEDVGVGADPFSDLIVSMADYLFANFGNYTTGDLTPENVWNVKCALEGKTRGTTSGRDLTCEGADDEPSEFTLEVIYGWLAASFTFEVDPAPPTDKAPAGAIFPMIPGLQITYGGTKTVFGDDPEPAAYIQALTAYLQSLSFLDTGTQAPTLEASAALPDAVTFFPGVVFHDYFNLLAKQLLGELEVAVEAANSSGATPAAAAGKTLDQYLEAIAVGNIAGVGTRFLQHGLRVPDPTTVGGDVSDMELAGLYHLTGQQFDIDATSLDVTLAVAPTDASNAGSLTRPSTTVTGDGKGKIPFALTYSPSPTNPIYTPAALPRFSWSPLEIVLRTAVPWTDGKKASSLFGFPERLLQEIGEHGTLQLELSQTTGKPNAKPTAVPGPTTKPPTGPTTGLMIRFGITTIPALGKSTHLFQVQGTDEANRDLMEHLFESGDLSSYEVDLLLPTAQAYQSSSTDDRAVLLKSNLSPKSQPDFTVMLMRADVELAADSGTGPGPGSSTTANATDFLRLLWEVSVVHAGGFYLYVPSLTPDDFGGQSRLDIAVLVRPKTPTLTVDGSHNVIIIDAGTVTKGNRLIASVFDAKGSTQLQTAQPNYPPGAIAFGASWSSPPSDVTGGDTTDYANALYHLIQYRLEAGAVVEESLWSLPLGPNEKDSSWEYRRAAPLYRFVGQGSDPNVYAAIGKKAEIGLQAVDVFGNATGIPGIDVQAVYNDRLVPLDEWPATRTVYRFTPGSAGNAALELMTVFDPSQVSPDLHDAVLQQYQGIHAQLTDPNVSVAVTTAMAAGAVSLTEASCGGQAESGTATAPKEALANLAEAIATYLAATGTQTSTDAPGPVCLVGSVPIDYVKSGVDEDLFPVWVSVEFSRTAPTETTPFSYPAGFLSVLAPVSPDLTKNGQSTASAEADATPLPSTLVHWAADFEAAFKGFDGGSGLLKTLVGKPPLKMTSTGTALGTSAAGAVTSVPGHVWALKWSASAGMDVSFDNTGQGSAGAPIYFAPAPLSTELLSFTTDIFTYDSTGKKNATGVGTSFTDVDLDRWARSFLVSVDGLFEPEMAAAIARTDAATQGTTSYYAQLLEARTTLAQKIAKGVTWVFADDLPTLAAPNGKGSLDDAIDGFQESLLVSLGRDYSTSVIVQAPATVSVVGDAESGSKTSPELFGTVAPAPDFTLPVSAGQTAEKDLSISTVAAGTPARASTAHQYTISNASLPIEKADPGYLTFLAGAVHPSSQAGLCLDLSYDIGFIDHSFDTAAEAFGYVPSSWLRFVLPEQDPGGAEGQGVLEPGMGAFDIPIPLRAYPSPPTLLDQSAAASSASPVTVSDALEWSYELTVGKPAVAQDDLHLEVTFNGVVSAARVSPTPRPLPLSAPLARFVSQYPGIDQAAILKGPSDPTAAAPWLADVLELVQDVAKAWGKPAQAAGEALVAEAPSVPAPVTYEYIIQIPHETDGKVHVHWTTGSGKAVFPTIAAADPPAGSSAGDDIQIYDVPPGDTVLAITWAALDVMSLQSASTEAFIRRNEDLAPCDDSSVDAEDGGTATNPTNPAFVYHDADGSLLRAHRTAARCAGHAADRRDGARLRDRCDR